ncbi:MAG: HAMP domain-containing protein [Acidobacteria bacterium]|nr:HAMP domain-containing protein [Acidobacteriota bacterium]
MNLHSMRFRLTAWYAVLLAGALVLLGFSVYIGLEHYLSGSALRTLAEQSHSIGSELLVNLPEKGPHWLAEEIEEAYAPEANGNFIRVSRSDGTPVYVSGQPKDNSFDPLLVPVFWSPSTAESSKKVRIPGGVLLVESLAFINPDGSRYIVENGTSYADIQKVLNGLLRLVALYLPFVVSLAGLGGYWLMRRSLRPVDEITRRAEGITSSNLSERLPVIKTGDELERLSIALNRMIARLEDAFQHIHRFSADASHELRTPLTILQLELEEIAQHRELPPATADQIGSALEETQRLSRIIENLMAIARLDAGEVKMDKVLLNLGDLATSTAEQMKLLAEEKSLNLNCRIYSSVRVLGDHSRLKQVIVNLIDNAIKYTPEGGAIEVTVRSSDGKGVLEVNDNGLGISPEVMPHVFERFYRADKARSRDSGGAGLGLAIVKAICSAHGAEVQVASQEGEGSRFRVELPLAQGSIYPSCGGISTWSGVSGNTG